MNRYQLTCKYCGEVWWDTFFSNPTEGIECMKCGDKNIKITDPRVVIDQYKGCPPFEEKEVKLEDPPLDLTEEFEKLVAEGGSNED